MFTVTATSSKGPTVVSVRILFWPEGFAAESDAILQTIKARMWAHSGPTDTVRGQVWDVYLRAEDLPDGLQDLEDLLWESDAVRKTVVTIFAR